MWKLPSLKTLTWALVIAGCACDVRWLAPVHAQTANGDGVSVLRDGRVYSGAISPVAGGYQINGSGGYVILPYEQVQVTAISMAAAYEAMRNELRNPSADDHLRLAEWCLTNGLTAEARREVEDALRLEPMRPEARAMLQRLDNLLEPTPPAAPAGSFTIQPAMNARAFSGPGDRTSSGLSRATQLEFIAHVQPLLMNKCGNATCHGQTSQNAFKLSAARLETPAHRVASDANMKLLMDYIDIERPRRSLLLVKPGEPTPAHQKLFLGERQYQQYQMLENWVLQVARERGPASSHPSPALAAKKAARGGPALDRPGSGVQQASHEMRQGAAAPAAPDVVDQIRQEQQPDAFDPGAFNRRMHSPPATGANGR
jgi:hypothetical protein